MKDLEGRYRLVNQAFERASGRERRDILGLTDKDLFPGEVGEQFHRHDLAVFASAKSHSFDEVMPGPDGGRRSLMAVKFPIRNASGTLTGLCAMRMDITERTLAEAKLRVLSRAIEQNPASVIITNTHGVIEYVNPAVQTITGYSEEELLGCNPRIFKSGGTPRDVYLQMWRTLARGEVWRGELSNRRKNGELFDERAVIAPVADETGSITHFVALKEDIAAQRRTEAALRETQERFKSELESQVVARTQEIEALLQSIPDTVLRVRDDGTLLNFQQGKGSFPPFVVSDRQSPDLGSCLHPDLHDPVLDVGTKALARNKTAVTEVVLSELDGTLPEGLRAVEIRAAPLRTNEFVVFIRDISARRRIEVETAAMLEKERQVSEMKSRFISVVSHEFRTPMTAALGAADLLHGHIDQLRPEKREELFQRIFSSIERLTGMLNEVLTLSRLDSGRLTTRAETVNLVRLVKEQVDELRMADQQHHRIAYSPPREDVALVSDPNLLRHIVSNLLSNAARYSAPGTQITVLIEEGPTELCLSVRDEGIGIPESDLHRIFEPFERGSNVGNIKGTGLGLNIVKQMAERLGGQVRVESTVGQGSRFTAAFSRTGAAAKPSQRGAVSFSA